MIFYGQDQGQHGQTEVLGLRTHYALHQAQQEEGKREALIEEVLQILPEEPSSQ